MPEKNRRISLSEVAAGEVATVLDFLGGRMVNNRLASLGFTPGVTVNMSQNYGRWTFDREGARDTCSAGTWRGSQDYRREGIA